MMPRETARFMWQDAATWQQATIAGKVPARLRRCPEAAVLVGPASAAEAVRAASAWRSAKARERLKEKKMRQWTGGAP
jgi:hypothetical protein